MHRRWPLIETDSTWDLVDSPLTLWGDEPESDVNSFMGPRFDSSRMDDSEMEGPISRHRFNSLLLWQARLATDSKGLAEIEIPLNDLLTSIRIVAVATAGTNLFGTGHVSVLTSQDLILNAGLPDVVRHGDRVSGVFTVRNASDKTQRIEAAGRIEGYLELPEKTVTLGAGESRELAWPITVPADREQLDWEVTARSETTADRLIASQSVQPSVPVRVQQATLTQVADSVELPVAPPEDALPGRGGIALSLRSSLAGGLEAMREYMEGYRYACFTCVEPLVSVAVALDDPSRWSAAMVAAGRAVDEEGLLRYFPVDGIPGSPVLTAYVLTIADAAGKVIPEGLRSGHDPRLEKLRGRERCAVRASLASAGSAERAERCCGAGPVRPGERTNTGRHRSERRNATDLGADRLDRHPPTGGSWQRGSVASEANPARPTQYARHDSGVFHGAARPAAVAHGVRRRQRGPSARVNAGRSTVASRSATDDARPPRTATAWPLENNRGQRMGSGRRGSVRGAV